MKATRTWILIADGARARILENDGPGKGVKAVKGGEFHTDLQPDREVFADRPGRTHDSAGPGRHAMEPPVSPHRTAKAEFARSLVETLDGKLAQGAFDRLIVVAPPQALGDLRRHFSGALKACLMAELHKDLTKVPDSEIASHLKDVLAV